MRNDIMNKKLLCTALAALMLTACSGEASRKDGEENGENLTESFTEEEQMPLPESGEDSRDTIELALFDPFSSSTKRYDGDEALQDEMRAAAEKISDARGFLYANSTAFYRNSKYYNSYADTENPLETNELEEYEYYPLNREIAATEDELARYIRSCFTENYISDDELTATLFERDEYGNAPEYKTIDGTLCMRRQYMGVMAELHFDRLICINSYDGESAQVVFYGEGIDYPQYFYMDIVKSEEYGWRLDGIEQKSYYENEARLLYNAVTLRTDTLNKILGGGDTPENPLTYYDSGELYTETNLDMTMEEMREFFADTFREKTLDYNEEVFEAVDGSDLRQDYTEKYINDVYIEQDGVLYRRDSAEKWYLPELRVDPFSGIKYSGGGYAVDSYFICEQDFYDAERDETFSEDISITYSSEYLDSGEYEYYTLYIASELPILSYDDVGAELIEIASYDIFSEENTVGLDDDAVEAVKTAVIIPRFASSYFNTYIPEKEDIHIIAYESSPSIATAAVRRNFHHPSEVEFIRVMEIENGWRTSGGETRDCYDLEVSLLCDILTENADIWNHILGGGTAGTETVEVDGEPYTENEMNMTVSEMQRFFADNLSAELCSEYTEKYIDSVYFERDGVLYRRDSAPLLYLLPYQPDPYNGMSSAGSLEKMKGNYSELKQDFYDADLGEYVKTDVRLVYRMPRHNWYAADEGDYMCRYFVYERYIDSELPIRERQIVPDK